MVPEGRKRSLNLSFDFADDKQEFGGYKTLNLLNAAGDPSFLRAVLYTEIASHYVPTPKMNYMRVVINGESWGLYVNAQQFNKDFTRDFFKSTKGARWKVPGSPGGQAGFNYLGDDPATTSDFYEITSKDDPKAWADLIKVFKVLNETPPDKLEAALAPIFDVDGALKFLAVEVALVNTDGFWTRASDYSLYQDEKGILHIIPHDVNEGMGPEEGGGRRGGGPGGFGPGRGPGGPPPGMGDPARLPASAARRIPVAAADSAPAAPDRISIRSSASTTRASRSDRSSSRCRPCAHEYLSYVREIADKWLDWKTLGPIAQKYHDADRRRREGGYAEAVRQRGVRDRRRQRQGVRGRAAGVFAEGDGAEVVAWIGIRGPGSRIRSSHTRSAGLQPRARRAGSRKLATRN